uniref:Uncharacterized protein n=1 Tax=Strix occidentalis caurina TaxID=311401 RepID=A0A8D0EHW5_STROC
PHHPRQDAGQEQLAQGWARLRRYQEEAGSELLHTNNEVVQLRAQLGAARHVRLQGVRGGRGVLKDPPQGEGWQYRPPQHAAEGRCPTRWWWEAGLQPLG